ncbi:uncharacterized protein EDB91DRAFT_1166196 [Suillus paluster]|uniref:uncharacterized protein n=1 Tax=Suillus paluster TaxID=48578 RepID=UPI001B869490|nr:uncharacterized protein EDB91DRAFT_1166196 [Suillus paluster]KAG1726534.1 hypothetical protein EDB91DRAFT_1166196 [Suillus paluster]
MIDWQDPEVIESCSLAFVDVTFLMLGLYGWECLHSCHVENALLRRQLSFQWHMVSICMHSVFSNFLHSSCLLC